MVPRAAESSCALIFRRPPTSGATTKQLHRPFHRTPICKAHCSDTGIENRKGLAMPGAPLSHLPWATRKSYFRPSFYSRVFLFCLSGLFCRSPAAPPRSESGRGDSQRGHHTVACSAVVLASPPVCRRAGSLPVGLFHSVPAFSPHQLIKPRCLSLSSVRS